MQIQNQYQRRETNQIFSMIFCKAIVWIVDTVNYHNGCAMQVKSSKNIISNQVHDYANLFRNIIHDMFHLFIINGVSPHNIVANKVIVEQPFSVTALGSNIMN